MEHTETLPFERKLLSGAVQFAAMIFCAMAFGALENWQNTWPAWSYYPAELLLAMSVRFGLGIVQDKPNQFAGAWKELRWRLIFFESIVWSWHVVFFLSAITASEKKNGMISLLGAGFIYAATLALSKNILLKFRCPHCKQFFFKPKSIKDREGVFPFALSKWPNTKCARCNWPIDVPDSKEAQKPVHLP